MRDELQHGPLQFEIYGTEDNEVKNKGPELLFQEIALISA